MDKIKKEVEQVFREAQMKGKPEEVYKEECMHIEYHKESKMLSEFSMLEIVLMAASRLNRLNELPDILKLSKTSMYRKLPDIQEKFNNGLF